MKWPWFTRHVRSAFVAMVTATAPLYACLAQENSQNASAAPVVVAARIVTEDGRILSQSPKGIPMEIGKPLDKNEVAESLRALYRSGEYADVKAVSVNVPGGVRLDFTVRQNYFFNVVRILGLTAPPSDASAEAAMQIPLGQPYRRETVDEAVARLKDTLQEEGLYQAQVSVETVPHQDTRQMDILVHIQPGPRARVGAVQIRNGTEYPDNELLARLRLKPGREITSARVQSGTTRVRNFLVKKGHLSARATVRRGQYDPENHTVPLEVEVTEGPRVQVVVAGAKFSQRVIRQLVPIYQEGAIDADLLEEGRRNLQERLERQGYFDAQVDFTTETRELSQDANRWHGTEEVITYRVERGVRHKLLGVQITGNRYFSRDILKGRLQVSPGGFGTPQRFSRRLIDADAASIRSLYFTNGFLSAEVRPNVQDNYQGREGNLFVTFEIKEGPQTRVAALDIEGNRAFTKDELLAVIGSRPGQPYSEYGVSTDRDNILAVYFNEGFPDATFTAKVETLPSVPPPEQRLADGLDQSKFEEGKASIPQAPPVKLIYHIEEGPQLRVRNIFISGYQHTKPRIIRREVQLKPNEPLRQGEVVESQRRLYNLGIFNRVTIEPQNPNGADTDKNIVVLVEEAKRYTLTYGGGFEAQRLGSTTNPTAGQVQASPRGIFEITKNNLTGRADSLSLKLRGSTIEDRALLAYSVPNTFGNPHYSGQALAYTEKTQDINTFTATRYEGAVQLVNQVSRITSIFYRYTFRKVLVSNLNSHIAPEEIPLFEQPDLVSQFGVTWVRDARDNPAEATKGSYNSAEFSDADTTIGSSASFLRFFFQNSTYYPIKGRRFSFARSVRFGVLVPYRDTVSLSFPAPTTPPLPTVIPLPERLFAGGGTTLRGFGLNQAGPRDSVTGFPVGGQAVLILNQEFRFPMHLPYVGTALGGALFYDAGNVYTRLSQISFRLTLPKPVLLPQPPGAQSPTCTIPSQCTNALNYFSNTVGLGLRYATPVGPIRIDLGYLINRPYIVVPCQSGSTSCFKLSRLPAFQIFFNLGSSF
ncbi:MAG: hypothetical protein C5B58_08845 [Acidobacteria bacterium]|nr:MAG: hypothetical protein C5B58_08845 [Acidobacteriota bacterium]